MEMIPVERIENKIFLIRGQKVMIDTDLANLYNVPTGRLNEQVKRNSKRFPSDFMFQLNKEEFISLRPNLISQNAMSSYGGRRHYPYAFTEQGIAMLSSVLNSERAIQVNIQIMRTFTKLREMIMSHRDLRAKIELMEKKYDSKFKLVFDAIKALVDDKNEQKPQPAPKKGKYGFI